MSTQAFPPVVSVLGHVDHGKTTLLDAIRKSDVAGGEAGGITQRIGISSIETEYDGARQTITFIDTPGHEAFTKMRSQGARVADVGLLIVSAVDGVMPQTKEALSFLKAAQTPFIVVFTKVDLPEKNVDKAKQMLLREDTLLEGYGGDIPYIEVSARTGHNVKELLDLILLVYSLHPKEASATGPLLGYVIESKKDPKTGPRATVIIKNGTITVRDEIQCGAATGRVRSMIDGRGATVMSASVGEGVEVTGFTEVPGVGSSVTKKGEKAVDQHATSTKAAVRNHADDSLLSIILCADTEGSLEAIMHSLPETVRIMEARTGEISEADVIFARSTGSIILTFNIKVRPELVRFAQTEKVLVKNYQIIYEMLGEIQQVIEGKASALLEQIYGVATIQASFPFEKTKVLGVIVNDGRVARGDKVRIVKADGTVVGESTIFSLRKGKDITSKAEKGEEAGIVITPELDFTIGDMVLSHN